MFWFSGLRFSLFILCLVANWLLLWVIFRIASNVEKETNFLSKVFCLLDMEPSHQIRLFERAKIVFSKKEVEAGQLASYYYGRNKGRPSSWSKRKEKKRTSILHAATQRHSAEFYF